VILDIKLHISLVFIGLDKFFTYQKFIDAFRHIEMSYVTEQILESLREARVRKGFSQRELSTRSGVPQSHISKIESGGVDLRMSSLIALARALELELFVVPKKSVPGISSIIRSGQGINAINGTYGTKGINDDAEQMSPAYQLEEGDDD
jgi:transcriptional regulator with XRE-family HTH domain